MNTTNLRRKALVTGAAGFVGSHLVTRLVNDKWDVHVLVRPASDLSVLQRVRNNITVVPFEGTAAELGTVFGNIKPDIVFHLASYFVAEHSTKDIERLVRDNVLFGTQVLEAMVKSQCLLLLNTGTSWQHYCNGQYRPVSLYAATKQALDAIREFYSDATALKTITLKLFDTYGPFDRRPKLFTLLRTSAQQHKPLSMSPGEQLLDLVYIDDVIDAYMLSAERLLANDVQRTEDYAVSSENPISLRDLVEMYGRVTGQDVVVRWGERRYREREVMMPWSSGKRVPGWSPAIDIEDGIRRMEGMV